MGGRIGAYDMRHREAQLARDLERRHPEAIHAIMFANHDGSAALRTVLRLFCEQSPSPIPEKCMSPEARHAARIIIFGHSWGASETVTLARRLNRLDIPVLLTIQVDSVQKANEDDRSIPPNVRSAVNFYQSQGWLHGRSAIKAADPQHTTILGNFESSYREHNVPCDGYPWLARTFMHSHIEIENDPAVWARIEDMIQSYVHE